MRTRLAFVAESLAKVARREPAVRQTDQPRELAPRQRAQEPAPERWKEPLPLMEDREGHLHVLL